MHNRVALWCDEKRPSVVGDDEIDIMFGFRKSKWSSDKSASSVLSNRDFFINQFDCWGLFYSPLLWLSLSLFLSSSKIQIPV